MVQRSKLAQAFSETLVGCVITCVENAKTVVGVALIITVLCVGVTAAFLTVNTDPGRMIDSTLPFRQHYREMVRAFPNLEDTFVVVVDAEEPEAAVAATRTLVSAFRSRRDLFTDIYAPEVDPFFDQNGLLYLSVDELRQLTGRLQAGVPLLVPLAQEPTLRGLSRFTQIIGYSHQQGADLSGFVPLLSAIGDTVRAQTEGRQAHLDWAGVLMPGGLEERGTRKFVVIKPSLDFSSLEPAEAALTEARRIIDAQPEGSARYSLTGEIAMASEELHSVADGALYASVISLILVSLVLIFGFRSWRLVTASLITLLIGLTWTAGVATLTVGYLNLISVAFAVMFFGLAIDFAIHFALRYEEEMRRGLPMPIAFANATEGVGGALAVCTGAASVGFLAFTPTSFVGMAQLGVISAAGMVIAFITTMTVLPAVLSLMPLPQRRAVQTEKKPSATLPDWRRPAVALTLVACVVSVAFLPQVRFDGDPINLKDPDSQAVKSFLQLFENTTTSPYLAQVLEKGDKQALAVAEKLTALPEVSRVITIFSFLPAEQDSKLPLIRQARAAMRQVPVQPGEDIGAQGRVEALNRMRETLATLSQLPDETFAKTAAALAGAISDFIEAHADAPERVAGLEQSLFAALGPTIQATVQALSAQEVSIVNLPEDIRNRYVSEAGHLRLEVFPSGNIADQDSLKAFAEAVVRAAPNASGSPVEIDGAAKAVVASMLQATAIAGILITLVLFLTLRRIVDVLLVLIPIILASLLTLATTVWIGVPFNFANVIVLPLLIGLGVAGGVHLVVRARISSADVNLFNTNTPRAVLLSALTTIGSFASLATSSHRGTASMGILLTVAIVFTLICTLIVLPQLIAWIRGRKAAVS